MVWRFLVLTAAYLGNTGKGGIAWDSHLPLSLMPCQCVVRLHCVLFLGIFVLFCFLTGPLSVAQGGCKFMAVLLHPPLKGHCVQLSVTVQGIATREGHLSAVYPVIPQNSGTEAVESKPSQPQS